MFIKIRNPKNRRVINFSSKNEYIYFFGKENYQCDNGEITLTNDTYVLRATPTGFFDNLQNNPQVQKGANQDGSDYLVDFKSERILTWQFNNLFAVGQSKNTWDYFSSIFNIKNQLLEITVFWLNPFTNEVIESNSLCYSTNNTSFEAGEVQVTLNGNGLWQRTPSTFEINPFAGSLVPHLYYNSDNSVGAVYTSDNRKQPFEISSNIEDNIQIVDITASTPIKVTVTATQIVDFEVENVQTGVKSKVLGTYDNSEIIIDSNLREVKINGITDLDNFVGGFIFLIEGINQLKFNNLNLSSTDINIKVEVIEYANSISG